MGCQPDLAQAIVAGGGAYVLALKGNQQTLHEGFVEHFLEHMGEDFARVEMSRHETKEKGHGRQEQRTYYVLDVPARIPDARRWKGLKQIEMAVSQTVRSGKAYDDVRFFILSRKLTTRRFGTMVRGHRGIKNSLRWQLDIIFNEDQSRTRKDHAAINLGGLRPTALSLLKRQTSEKVGFKNRRLIAGRNTDYLRKVLIPE